MTVPIDLQILLARRGVALWVLVRLTAWTMALIVGVRDVGLLAPLLVTGAVSVADLLRRREDTLMRNLGLSQARVLVAYLWPALIGELAIAMVMNAGR